MLKSTFRLSVMGLTLLACTHQKKSTITVQSVKPVDSSFAAPVYPYRESNPRTNDLIHTRLDVSFDWKNSQLNGKATLLLTPFCYATDRLYLNAKGFDIKTFEVFAAQGVTGDVNAVPSTQAEPAAAFTYENDSIKIQLGKVFNPGDKYFVVINYVAKPNTLKNGGSNAITEDKGLYFINPDGANPFKMPQVWTQGETQASSAWFPTIDSPNEKMTQDIYMTVDEKYTTLSNGTLVDSQKSNGQRIDHWKLSDPHSPYLVMMAAGEFVKVTDTPWSGKEISYYVEKQYEPYAKAIFGETRDMIEFYSVRLGVPYAWPKYAQIAARDYVSGAMENTSATLHGDFMVYQTDREAADHNRATDVIAHELFHQWFGDLVTSESWSNLPLNESFATYGEYMWIEHRYGRDAADHHHLQSRMGYISSNMEKELIRYHYRDKEDMFDQFSYNKGGQVLHMLRKAVGDEAFFSSLKQYLTVNRFKAAEIHNLRLAFEEVTGRDMNWFFDQWFLSKGRPKLKISWKHENGMVILNVKQTQDLKENPLYRLPMEVDVYNGPKATRHHIEVNTADQTFTIYAASRPDLVNVDAERQLLADMDMPKTKEELMFQYRHAPLFQDRDEALKGLDSLLKDEAVYQLYKDAATTDKYYSLRSRALNVLAANAGTHKDEVKSMLINASRNDADSRTRTTALSLLAKNYASDPETRTAIVQSLNDGSPGVQAEALEQLAKADPAAGMKRATELSGDHSKAIMMRIAKIYAEHGSDDQIGYFRTTFPYLTGFDIGPMCNQYAKTAKRCKKEESIRMVAKDLEGMSIGAGRFTKFPLAKALKDLSALAQENEKKTRDAIDQAKKNNQSTDALEAELKNRLETSELLKSIMSKIKS